MFSGIIESLQQVRSCKQRDAVIEIKIDRPDFFDDVKLGDSIACNGVCLTVEAFSEGLLTFAVGPETLHVTGWTLATLDQKWVNLERSMALGDRVHGHLVAGHVDATGKVLEVNDDGGTRFLKIQFGPNMSPYLWRKGSVAIDGVSLTINKTEPDSFDVLLIPETLKRTNLGRLVVGDIVNLEADLLARGLLHNLENLAALSSDKGHSS